MDEKILKKIKKCLALAKSSNPHEAATALRQAQALMREHGISADDVDLSNVREHTSNTSDAANTPPRWFSWLVTTINRAFGTDAIYTYGINNRVTFVGIDNSAEIASYAFNVLYRQAKKDRNDHIASLSNRCKKTTKTRKGDVFAEAWVAAVESKIIKFALPPEHKQLIATYKANRHTDLTDMQARAPKPSNGKRDDDYASARAGYEKGKQAQLNHGVNGSDQLRLGGAA